MKTKLITLLVSILVIVGCSKESVPINEGSATVFGTPIEGYTRDLYRQLESSKIFQWDSMDDHQFYNSTIEIYCCFCNATWYGFLSGVETDNDDWSNRHLATDIMLKTTDTYMINSVISAFVNFYGDDYSLKQGRKTDSWRWNYEKGDVGIIHDKKPDEERPYILIWFDTRTKHDN